MLDYIYNRFSRNFLLSYYPLQHFKAITPQLHKPMLNIQDSSPTPPQKKQTNKQKSTLGA